MHLKILLPTEILVDQPVTKVIAEAENGSFCLLPRHVDFLAALAPGILTFETEVGQPTFLAVDEGILVKSGTEVLISIRNAVRGDDLDHLKQQVEQQFRVVDEQERLTQSALASLEASLARHFMEL
ncbi:MAG: F0F1 ATP synthase subunit epsilon [Cyanothece sp. SIO1E1]|nr:F0F1 ATP synthase subunit epsilon [Cyanothece sp. SIO1E1]